MRLSCRRAGALAIGVLLGLSAAAAADSLYFSRTFPGSVPPYFEVTIDGDGSAVYKEAPDDEFPIEFQLAPEERERVFGLVDQIDFSEPFEKSKRKVAFTGDKVLRYEGEGGGEVRFAYTEHEAAADLTTFFVYVAETERHLIALERALQFDRLGVNKALLQFQASYDKDRVIAPKQFLPLLREIVAQDKVVHLARSRASALIERIEGTVRSE